MILRNRLRLRHVALLVFGLSLTKALFTSHYGINLIFDDNQQYLSAHSINQGKLIYRDFQSFFPPGSDYHVALVLRYTENILHLRYFHSIIFSFLPVIIFLLGYKISKDKKVSFLSSMLLVFVPNRPDKLFLHTFLALSIFFYYKYLKTEKNSFLFFSGIPLSLTLFFRYDFTLYVFLAILFVIIIKNHLSLKTVEQTLYFSAPSLMGLFFLVGFLVSNSILELMVRQTFFVPLIVNSELANNLLYPLPLREGLNNITFSIQSLNTFLESGFYWFFLAILGIVLLFIYQKKYTNKSEKYLLTTLLFASLLSFPYIFGNMDTGHLLKGGFLFTVLIPYVYKNLTNFGKKFFSLLLLLFLIVFAARTVWWINFNDKLVDFGNKGKFYMNSQHTAETTKVSAETYISAVDFLKDSEEKYVFSVPNMSSLYYFSENNPPTIYENMMSGYLFEPYNQEYVVGQIKNKNVERVVYDPLGGRMSELGGMSEVYPKIDKFLMQNYTSVKETKEGWLFMIKKE